MDTETAPKPVAAEDATTSKVAVNIFPVAEDSEAVFVEEPLNSVEAATVLDTVELVATVELDDVETSAEDGVSKAVTTEVDKMELSLALVLAKIEIFM